MLRVGTSGRSVPHSYKNEQQELDGFDIEAIKAIAAKIGYKVEWTTADFSGLFGMLDAGKIDFRTLG
ncbi:transporter substrate-binding domain-containing protein [Paenibacillus piri]|uniref:Transporter substrate-binding domain-containing protein n=1 Tax=Paenibacillus piri TaxID=2547395 RepID=A0A4V2ZTX3_9BACL|nr:transporter substrate-binding domain-containing protein [Paenibacillus piri]TDF98794.1 transporter substrate-binding domain-containing protein [Paenibacillus piri]